MPVKRRIEKARHFDDDHRQQLLEGPDAVLFAGAGYLAGLSVGSFDLASPEEQAAVLKDMRGGWAHYGPELMETWRSGEPDPGLKPWALREFGEPDAR